MSVEENKSVVQGYFAGAYTDQGETLVDELLTPDYVGHFPPNPDVVGWSRESWRTALEALPRSGLHGRLSSGGLATVRGVMPVSEQAISTCSAFKLAAVTRIITAS